MADIATILRAAAAELAAAGVADPMGDARRLLNRHVPGTLAAQMRDPLPDMQYAAFMRDIAARAARRPVSHILGYREFWGRRFTVTPDVLDPRPDTETLIEAALALPQPATILDLGTGSGAILATLLAEWPQATGLATDISAKALDVARANLDSHAPGRWRAVQSDWFDAITGQFDLIVSNPPYITQLALQDLAPEVRDFEPHLALTPGGDGLDAYRRIATQFPRFLAPKGHLLLEIGFDQGDSVSALFTNMHVTLLRDLNEKARVVKIHAHQQKSLENMVQHRLST